MSTMDGHDRHGYFGMNTVGVGLLGAKVVDEHLTPQTANAAQFHEIERRILRIEMALRRAGIEVELTEFLT